ncbi:hypothetical protein [Paenibacillus sp. Soil522]|uniref:hypothetical protein n=1 Tax=Paenibacillus sp. Soil522 TaxID=1736388 RepID=UPI001F1B111B|nr:hypothetical protein [Paenibacillus sp. Soil522]
MRSDTIIYTVVRPKDGDLLMEKAKQMNQWSKIPELIDIMGDNFSFTATRCLAMDIA